MSAGEGEARPADCAGDFEVPERLGAGAYRLASPVAMRALGEALGRVLQAGDVVVLTGDLGAGKTCLTGGVAAGLGDTSPVTSPTFTIMAVHDEGRIPLYHFDLYRLEDAGQLEDVGIYDVLDGEGACLVEWGEAYAEELGDERLDVRITRAGADACVGGPAGSGTPGQVATCEAADADADAGVRAAAGSDAFAEPARILRATPHGARATELLAAWDAAVQTRGAS